MKAKEKKWHATNVKSQDISSQIVHCWKRRKEKQITGNVCSKHKLGMIVNVKVAMKMLIMLTYASWKI